MILIKWIFSVSQIATEGLLKSLTRKIVRRFKTLRRVTSEGSLITQVTSEGTLITQVTSEGPPKFTKEGNKMLNMLRRVTSEGTSKIFKFFNLA